jgi:hypothetical protein
MLQETRELHDRNDTVLKDLSSVNGMSSQSPQVTSTIPAAATVNRICHARRGG